jgi:hypothetical protein
VGADQLPPSCMSRVPPKLVSARRSRLGGCRAGNQKESEVRAEVATRAKKTKVACQRVD